MKVLTRLLVFLPPQVLGPIPQAMAIQADQLVCAMMLGVWCLMDYSYAYQLYAL
jgi:hypothetical protein